MIIEFIGSTGAGKTTLISMVQPRLAEQRQVVTSFELVSEAFGLGGVTNATVRNLIQDLAALPYFLGSLYRHREFVTFALESLVRHRRSAFYFVNYLRSIVRKVGMYEIARRHHHGRLVIVDEGTLLSAHLLFVYTSTRFSQEEIERFARLVPMPELAVYVRAPVKSLVERSLQRNDAPKEMGAEDREQIEEYVCQAAEMFDRLAATRRIQERTLMVQNLDYGEGESGVVAEYIAACILRYAAGRDRNIVTMDGRNEQESEIEESYASQN